MADGGQAAAYRGGENDGEICLNHHRRYRQRSSWPVWGMVRITDNALHLHGYRLRNRNRGGGNLPQLTKDGDGRAGVTNMHKGIV